MPTKTESRSIEVELEIDAPPEAVWKALTDPEELSRWFPLSASVEPGRGGVIALSWGDELTGANRILEWEPGRRLRTTWFEPREGETRERPAGPFDEDPAAAARLVVDTFLEGRGGGTVLRLVHSGFSKDARWDEEFDGHKRGWNFELRSLRQYLNFHAGQTRHVAWVRRPIGDLPPTEALGRVLGPDGLGREGGVRALRSGEPYAVTTVHGDRLEGTVFNNDGVAEFAATVDSLDHSLLRCGIETYFAGRPEALFWLSTWGGPERAAAFRGRWTETLRSLFPA